MADIAVQRGQITFSNAGVTTATLTAGVDYTAPSDASKAFVRITGQRTAMISSALDTSPADWAVSVDDSAIGTSIVFTRVGTSTNRLPRIDWEIVEYTGAASGAHEFIVRGRGVTNIGSTSNTATTGTISGVVTDADVVPFITGVRISFASFNYAPVMFRSVWNSAGDTITLERDRGNTAECWVSWAAVEFTGSAWSVQTADVDLVAGSQTASITSVGDVTRAFVEVQPWGLGTGAPKDSTVEVYLSAADTITAVTDASFAGSNFNARCWVVANSQTGTGAMSVQRFNGSLATQNGTFTVSPSSVVLADASVVEISARSTHTGTTVMPRDAVSWRLTGTTTLTGEQRNNTASTTTDYRVAVVTWPTATASSARFRPYFITG